MELVGQRSMVGPEGRQSPTKLKGWKDKAQPQAQKSRLLILVLALRRAWALCLQWDQACCPLWGWLRSGGALGP